MVEDRREGVAAILVTYVRVYPFCPEVINEGIFLSVRMVQFGG